MRFFYALIMFLISSYVIFWLFVFMVPTPKLYMTDDVKVIAETDETDERFLRALEIIHADDRKNIFYFEENIAGKRLGALLLYAFFSFVVIFFSVVLFHSKSYILLPLIAATVLSLVFCSLLWMMPNSFPAGLFFDLAQVRQDYGGLKAFQFLSIYLFMEIFLLGIGFWYKIP